MAKGDELKHRILRFGASIIGLCEELSLKPSGKHIASQLLRSATSAVANYMEARGAESAKDFVHKLGLVLKELNESEGWLETIFLGGIMTVERVTPYQQECTELCKIIAVSRRTARKSLGS